MQPFDKTKRPVEFDITFNNVSVHVIHQGDPPELFQAGVPVVLEGHWQGDVFAEGDGRLPYFGLGGLFLPTRAVRRRSKLIGEPTLAALAR